jgi:hypothetical protein
VSVGLAEQDASKWYRGTSAHKRGCVHIRPAALYPGVG